MKRLTIFLIILTQLGVFNAAEKKNYLNYENLPPKAQIFFNAHGIGFYIRPQDASKLGNENAYKNFLLSNVIKKALEQGKGDPIDSIQLNLSREEFLAFVNFAKLFAEMQSFEAFEEAFRDFNGFEILQSLAFDPAIINEIKMALRNKALVQKSESKKRKMEQTLGEIVKKLKGYPTVEIVRSSTGGLKPTLVLTDEQVAKLVLADENALVNDLIQVAKPGETITIELQKPLADASIALLQSFIDIVNRAYHQESFNDIEKIYNILNMYISFNSLKSTADIKYFILDLKKLADFFGYTQLSNALKVVINETKMLNNNIDLIPLLDISADVTNAQVLEFLLKSKLITYNDFNNIPELLNKWNEIHKLFKLFNQNQKLDDSIIKYYQLFKRINNALTAHNPLVFTDINAKIEELAQDLPASPTDTRSNRQRFIADILMPLFAGQPLTKNVLVTVLFLN